MERGGKDEEEEGVEVAEEEEEVGKIAGDETDVCKVHPDNTDNRGKSFTFKPQGGRKVNDKDDNVWIRW